MAESRISRISVREVVVDFFGSLVPGLVFTAATLMLFSWPVFSLIALIFYLMKDSSAASPLNVASYTQALQNSFNIEILLFTLMISYVVGHLFYRQDPKEPDKCSFRRIKKGFERNLNQRKEEYQATKSTDGKPKDEVTEKSEYVSELRDWVVQEVDDCEFPYPNLHRYLNHRGLHHLARMVPWPKHKKNIRRTKNFINILKIRLAFHYPDKYDTIARNEAHIRLMSSTWYMSRLLKWLSIAALIIAIIPLGFVVWSQFSEFSDARSRNLIIVSYCVPAAMPLIMYVSMFWIKRTIEKFIHYQRVREVIFVLETANTAFKDAPEIIQDICPDYLKDGQNKEKENKSTEVPEVA